jgi:hypothetical protein
VKRTTTCVLLLATLALALSPSAQATGKRVHKPLSAAGRAYEPPDPCRSRLAARRETACGLAGEFGVLMQPSLMIRSGERVPA